MNKWKIYSSIMDIMKNQSLQYWAQMESQVMFVPMTNQRKLYIGLLGPKSIRKSTVSRQNDFN